MNKTLTIEGQGLVFASPDQMILTFRLYEEDIEFDAAYKSLEEECDEISTLFKKVGFNPTFIEKSGINITIEDDILFDEDDYDFDTMIDNALEVDTYTCTQLLTFKDTIDFKKLSELVDLLDLNPSTEFNISYDISNYDTIKNDALILAINDANDKAKLISDNAGIKLGSVIEIDYFDYDEDIDPLDPVYFEFDIKKEVSQRVSMVWEIK